MSDTRYFPKIEFASEQGSARGSGRRPFGHKLPFKGEGRSLHERVGRGEKKGSGDPKKSIA